LYICFSTSFRFFKTAHNANNLARWQKEKTRTGMNDFISHYKENKLFKSLFFSGLVIQSRATSAELLKSGFKWHDLIFYTTFNATIYFNLLIHSRKIPV